MMLKKALLQMVQRSMPAGVKDLDFLVCLFSPCGTIDFDFFVLPDATVDFDFLGFSMVKCVSVSDIDQGILELGINGTV